MAEDYLGGPPRHAAGSTPGSSDPPGRHTSHLGSVVHSSTKGPPGRAIAGLGEGTRCRSPPGAHHFSACRDVGGVAGWVKRSSGCDSRAGKSLRSAWRLVDQAAFYGGVEVPGASLATGRHFVAKNRTPLWGRFGDESMSSDHEGLMARAIRRMSEFRREV